MFWDDWMSADPHQQDQLEEISTRKYGAACLVGGALMLAWSRGAYLDQQTQLSRRTCNWS